MTPQEAKAAPKGKKRFLVQPMMVHVCYGLAPCLAASVFFFGVRSLVLLLMVTAAAVIAEGLFTLKQGKPITSAVLVTSLIYTLSLPPTIPFWMALVGILFAVVFGKMVFGGFGFNAFNPAMAGRCFIYIAFPTAMTNKWVEPFSQFPGGFLHWTPSVDAVSRATPLQVLAEGGNVSTEGLFWGTVSGSLGETAAWLILIGGAYIIFKKSAPWRLAVSCLLGAAIVSILLWWAGVNVQDPLTSMLAGSFLFGAFFVVTEPITGPKTKPAQWIYGFIVGGLCMTFRAYSSFAEGFMFSVLFMNTFAAVMDIAVKELQHRGEKKA